MEDLLSYISNEVVREVDEKECARVLDQINPFIVVEIITGYQTVNFVKYVDRFSTKDAANNFITNKEIERINSFELRKKYIKQYIDNCSFEEIRNIKKLTNFVVDQNEEVFSNQEQNLVLYLADTEFYDNKFFNYNPPKKVTTGLYFTVKIESK